MVPYRTADNIMMPPPMWWISYVPSPSPDKMWIDIGGQATPDKGKRWTGGGRDGRAPDDPNHPSINLAGHNAWRWNMDIFTCVLLNVSVSPTAATDGIQVPTDSGWPLVTTLKLSFLEVDQALATAKWNSIIPYSWAQDEDNKFFGGFKGVGASPL